MKKERKAPFFVDEKNKNHYNIKKVVMVWKKS